MPVSNLTLMVASHYGELAALITTVFWTITALSFETAGKRIGSLHLNLLRLGVAFTLLTIFSWIRRDMPLPSDAGIHQWKWLILSGIVGFVIGDYCLFRAFIVIGARVSMLIMTLAPIVAAFTGWIFLGDRISLMGIAGMSVTLMGISLVIFEKKYEKDSPKKKDRPGLKLALPAQGLLLAVVAAFGQGIGLVMSREGMNGYDPFSSAQIRVIAGFLGFAILFTLLRKWKELPASLHDRKAMLWLFVGSVFGPFLGVSFSMIAVQHTSAGIAQTIMSLVPVMIIPPAFLISGEKPGARQIIGALIAVAGVTLFFL